MRFSGGGNGGVGEEKGIKCSDIGTMGKRDVQNVYFSNGVEVGKGEIMMRDVEWRVHYVNSLPPPPPRRSRRRGWSRVISTQAQRAEYK